MKTSLWSIIVLVTGVVGFLMGYSVSSVRSRGAAPVASPARGPAGSEVAQLQEEVARLRLGLGQVEADVGKLREALAGGRVAERHAAPGPGPRAATSPEKPPAPKAAAAAPRPEAPAPPHSAPQSSPAKTSAAGY